MKKLIVFDCDGVMFDSKAANIAYYNNLLERFGRPPMSSEEEAYVHMASVAQSTEHIFRHPPAIEMEEVVRIRSEIGYEPFLQYMKMEEDLVEFLDSVAGQCRLAVCTNRTQTMVPLLKTYSLDSYFEKVVTAHTVARPKPAPDGLLEILDFFSCPAREAIFIGDSIVDLQQARACEVELIAFKSGELKADYHVNSFMEIWQLEPFASMARG